MCRSMFSTGRVQALLQLRYPQRHYQTCGSLLQQPPAPLCQLRVHHFIGLLFFPCADPSPAAPASSSYSPFRPCLQPGHHLPWVGLLSRRRLSKIPGGYCSVGTEQGRFVVKDSGLCLYKAHTPIHVHLDILCISTNISSRNMKIPQNFVDVASDLLLRCCVHISRMDTFGKTGVSWRRIVSLHPGFSTQHGWVPSTSHFPLPTSHFQSYAKSLPPFPRAHTEFGYQRAAGLFSVALSPHLPQFSFAVS